MCYWQCTYVKSNFLNFFSILITTTSIKMFSTSILQTVMGFSNITILIFSKTRHDGVPLQNVEKLWAWKAVQSLTHKSVLRHSLTLIMPPSRADYTFRNLQVKQDHGQLAPMMSISGCRLILVIRQAK